MVGALPSSSSYPRVLLGIFSAISDRERRHMIRSTMLHSPPPSFQHTFVVCATASFEHATAALRAENDQHNRDLLILHVGNFRAGYGYCGKHRGVLEFFAEAAKGRLDLVGKAQSAEEQAAQVHYEWVLKTDSDAYIVLPNLMRELQPLSRTDGYYGMHCNSANRTTVPRDYSLLASAPHRQWDGFIDDRRERYAQWFMCGMCYGFTADVVAWLASSHVPRSVRCVGDGAAMKGSGDHGGGVEGRQLLSARAQHEEPLPPAQHQLLHVNARKRGGSSNKKRCGVPGEDLMTRWWLHAGSRGTRAYSCGWLHCFNLPPQQQRVAANAAFQQGDLDTATAASLRALLHNATLLDESTAATTTAVHHQPAASRPWADEAVVVHGLKSDLQWAEVSRYYVARHRILAARALRYAARQAPHRHHAPWGMQLELADR